MTILPHPETDATSVAAYWGVIPAPVRYCKALQPAAKLLFSEITALCKREGYCWATNAHFQALYDVERYTVQRWLAALVREGFIRVELTPGTGDRRIYDLTIPPQKRDGGVTKKLPPRHKNAQNPPQKGDPEWYIKNKEKKEIESDARGRFVGPGPVPARELQAQDEKVPASPSTVKSKSGSGAPSAAKIRNVQRAIALTGHAEGKRGLEQLWDALVDVGKSSAWSGAVEHIKSLPGRPTMPSKALAWSFVTHCSQAADIDETETLVALET